MNRIFHSTRKCEQEINLKAEKGKLNVFFFFFHSNDGTYISHSHRIRFQFPENRSLFSSTNELVLPRFLTTEMMTTVRFEANDWHYKIIASCRLVAPYGVT